MQKDPYSTRHRDQGKDHHIDVYVFWFPDSYSHSKVSMNSSCLYRRIYILQYCLYVKVHFSLP